MKYVYVSAFILISALTCNILAVQAHDNDDVSNQAQYSLKLQALEQCFFSCSHKEQNLQTRLEKLELLTYGTSFDSQDLDSRIKRLEVLASKQKSINENTNGSSNDNTDKIVMSNLPSTNFLDSAKNNTAQPSDTNFQVNSMASGKRIHDMLEAATNAFRNGDKNSAKCLFEDILTLEPDNADANFSLGIVYESLGNLVQAATYYSIAAAIDPDNRDYKEALLIANKKLQNCL